MNGVFAGLPTCDGCIMDGLFAQTQPIRCGASIRLSFPTGSPFTEMDDRLGQFFVFCLVVYCFPLFLFLVSSPLKFHFRLNTLTSVWPAGNKFLQKKRLRWATMIVMILPTLIKLLRLNCRRWVSPPYPSLFFYIKSNRIYWFYWIYSFV